MMLFTNQLLKNVNSSKSETHLKRESTLQDFSSKAADGVEMD